MKRVAHLTFHMKIGGAERVIYNLVTAADRSRFDMSVACIDQPLGAFAERLMEGGLKTYSFTRRPGFDRNLLLDLRRLILREKFDILHCHQYTPFVYGGLAALGTGTRVLYTEHGRFYPDRKRLKRTLLNPLLEYCADVITAISEATKRALVQYENFSADKIHVVYNGVPRPPEPAGIETLISEFPIIRPDSLVFGTVARLDSIKNHSMMIRMMKAIGKDRPEAVLIIVGDGPERSNLESLIHALGLSDRVAITGFREDVESFYPLMHVFLLTSYSEGTAMTLLEAMASGLPSIATNVGGNPEIVEHAKTGFLVGVDADRDFAEFVSMLGSDSDLRDTMGRNARERFDRMFTVKRMVHRYEEVYQAMCNKEPLPIASK